MISNSVTHVRSYTNTTIADIGRNSEPILPETPCPYWNCHGTDQATPLEFFFQEQSYSSLHLGRSLAWDHVRGDINDPCGAIANFCGVIADFCGVIAIHEVIGGRAGTDARRQSLRDSLSIIKHSKTS